MLLENFSANVDALLDIVCYIHRCEGLAALVLEILGIELALRKAKVFRAYHPAVTGHSPQLEEYGLKQGTQFRHQNELGPHLSKTFSFERV